MAVLGRESVLASVEAALAAAPATTSRVVKDALKLAAEFLSDVHVPPVESPVEARGEIPAPLFSDPTLIPSCIERLESAIALRVGVMDSDSKRDRVDGERLMAMQEVAERLRAA
jgi:hypothetical protein